MITLISNFWFNCFGLNKFLVQNSEKDIEEPEKERTIAYEKLFRKKRTPTDNIKTLELERHERKIKQIAKDFIDWSKVLGEDGPELSEDTIQVSYLDLTLNKDYILHNKP